MLSALLALAIGSIVSIGVIEGKLTESQMAAGSGQADVVALIASAANAYVVENYLALQNDQAVIKNGVTLAAGASALAPTVQNLIDMGYLVAGTSSMATVNSGKYQIQFSKSPAGCVGTACNMPGFLYIDKPVVLSQTADMNGVVIGSFLRRLGGDALVALNTDPTVLRSMSGATVANPLAGAPEGVIGARVGFGSSAFGNFLRLNDSRDPNFQGNLTVAKEIKGDSVVGTASVGSGTGSTGCRLGEILNSGEILSRSANCVRVAWMDPANGSVNVADSAGRNAVEVDGFVRELRMRDASGNVIMKVDSSGRIGSSGYGPGSVPSGWSGGVSTLDVIARGSVGAWDGSRVRAAMSSQGDLNLYSSIGNAVAGIQTSTGSNRVWADTLGLNGTGTVGQPCGALRVANDIAINAGGAGLVMCNGSIWVAISLAAGVSGGTCTTDGAVGAATDGSSLFCSGGKWVSFVDRIGKRIFAESFIASNDGGFVRKPACLSGSTGSGIFLSPKNEETRVRNLNRYAVETASGGINGWAVYASDGDNVSVPGEMVATTYCLY